MLRPVLSFPSGTPSMPQHKEKRQLPFSPDQLFDLVADIERYPEFLPWCLGARIREREGDTVTADLVIGYKMFRETFTSVVTLDRPHAIAVSYRSGPLAHLANNWQFAPGFKDGVRGGCELSFHVAFDFHSRLLAAVMEPFFDKALSRMAEAFEKRAEALYGKG
jgi:coenzyme Q-binding protein COQ10